jgi:hypothetical protein
MIGAWRRFQPCSGKAWTSLNGAVNPRVSESHYPPTFEAETDVTVAMGARV